MKLGKRKLPSGLITYYLDDFHNGERIREALGVTVPPGVDSSYAKNQKRLAEKKFQARQEEILLSRKGLSRDSAISLVAYAEGLTKARDGKDHLVRLLPYVREYFGTMELRSVDYRACEAFQAHLSNRAVSGRTGKPLSAKTVKHYFSALAFLLNEAVRDRYIERSPASSVRRFKVPEKVVIALTAEELEILWRFPMNYPNGQAVKTAFFVAANTGLRLGDIRSLCWGDIETRAEGWRLVKAQDKTGNRITIPLNKNVQDLLKTRFSLSPTASVFPEFQLTVNPARDIGAWARAAGLSKQVTFHTARHTFGTLVSQAGGESLVVQNLMGHTTRAMTEHYTQAAGGAARDLVDALPRLVGIGGGSIERH